MKKTNIFIIATILSTHCFSSFAGTCSDEIEKLVQARKLKADRAMQYVRMFSASTLGLGFPLALGVAAPILIKTKHARNILELLDQAAQGQGHRLDKLHKKVLRKGYEISYADFAQRIFEADHSGELCDYEAVPERGEVISIVLDE